MAEPSATKLDPAEEAKAGLEPQLAKDETEKVTTGATESKKDEAPAEGAGVTDKVANAASATTSAVFSMFGGGPKKEKKEEEDAVDEPSGSSKAKKGEDVSHASMTSAVRKLS